MDKSVKIAAISGAVVLVVAVLAMFTMRGGQPAAAGGAAFPMDPAGAAATAGVPQAATPLPSGGVAIDPLKEPALPEIQNEARQQAQQQGTQFR
jgi:hypothetical protein